MGTPATTGARHDAMYDLGGNTVSEHIRKNFKPKSTTILDVGAGWGKYRLLLPEYKMDAVEVWKPYIEEEKLKKLYGKVYEKDICDVQDINYDVVIMGDVLEHIERERAVPLVERIKKTCKQLYVVVPYNYPQHEVNGNKHEIHHQDDLTDELVQELYGLKLLVRDEIKGVYCL